MAKYWLRLFLLVGSVVAMLALIGSLLPRSYDFGTAIVINAPRDRVFPMVNRLQSWPQWSRQWNTQEIEDLEINYNNIEQGVGAAQTWKDRRGDGKLWITDSVENDAVRFDMEFANFPRMASSIELTDVSDADGSKTKVSWSSKGRLPAGPLYGVMAPFFPEQMKYEYDKSLERLKKITESNADEERKPNDQPKPKPAE